MSSWNLIITACDVVSEYIVDVKTCFVYIDVSGQTPYYKGGVAELNKSWWLYELSEKFWLLLMIKWKLRLNQVIKI